METVEYDSEDEDAGADLSSWLQKLCTGTGDSGQSGDVGNTANRSASKGLLTQSDTVESFRYSVMMDLGSSGACDLDDIISDLCALEAQLSSECVNGAGTSNKSAKFPAGPSTDTATAGASSLATDEAYESRSSTTSSANSSLSRESGTRYLNEHQLSRRGTLPGPAVLSPGAPVHVQKAATAAVQCAAAAAGERWTPASSSAAPAATMSSTVSGEDRSPSSEQQRNLVNSDARTKEEKIMLAIQKIKDADIKKLFVKMFIENGDCKTLLIDENMTTYDVIQMLFDKCPAFKANVRWAVIEQIPDLLIERIIEDHERLVFVMLNWLKVSNNRVLFLQTDDKYDLFFQPQNYLLEKKAAASCSEKDQKVLLDDLFSGTGCPVLELESDLHVKVDGQKSWKKISAVLRSSGIYLKKGKASRSALQCIVQFDQMDIYRGFGWKKKHKAPSEHCFALKRAEVQRKSKDGSGMKYFCCDDDYTLRRWLTGLRIVKYGAVLNDNFKHMVDLVAANGTAGDRVACNQGSGLAGLRTETASHGSRDSGFSIASGGSSGSLECAGGTGATMAATPAASATARHVPPPPPLEFSDLPPPPPELLRSACSTPAMSTQRRSSASSLGAPSSPMHRFLASDSPLSGTRGASSLAEVGTAPGACKPAAAAACNAPRPLLPAAAITGAGVSVCGSLASASRNSAASSSSSASSCGSTPSNSVQSLIATDMLPSSSSDLLLLHRGQQTQSPPPAVPAKPRAISIGGGGAAAAAGAQQLDRVGSALRQQQPPLHRSSSSKSTSSAVDTGVRPQEPPADLSTSAAVQADQQPPVRASFDRLDPCRRTCPATPKRTVSIKQPAQAGAEASADTPQPLLQSIPDSGRSSTDAFGCRPFPKPVPDVSSGRPAVAAKPFMTSMPGGSGNRAAAAPEAAMRPLRTTDVYAGSSVDGKQGFLEELSTVYAKRGLTKPSTPAVPAAVAAVYTMCDIDDLPPPPPELLLDTTATVPSSGSDKLHFNMGQVFASQTGTIKRAPPLPPKRQETIAAVTATGSSTNMHAQYR